jgi:amino acid transporter
MTVDVKAVPSGGHGLIRALGAGGLAAAIANTVIGSGIFRLPAAMAAAVGSAAPLYYLFCAIAVGMVAICFAEAGSRVAVSGGIAGGVERALGGYAGFVTSTLIWLGSVLAAAGVNVAVADGLGLVMPIFKEPLWRDALIGTLIATLAAVNITGVKAGAGLSNLVIVLKLVPLLTLVIVGGLHVQPHFLTGAAPKADIGRALLLGIFAFMGMETALGVSGEVKNPRRNVPLGLLGALAAVAVLYMAIQLVCEGLLGPALAGSTEPLAAAMSKISPLLGALLVVGATISRLGYLTSDTLAAPRFLYAMASDGFLPKGLAAVGARTRTPYAAIITHSVLTAGLALTGTFEALVALSTLVVIIPYVIGSVAAVVLQRRGVAEEGKPLNLPFTPVAAVVGILFMGWVATHASVLEAIETALAVVVTTIIYAVSRLRRRAG